MTFAFFHVGENIGPPTILVRSLLQQHPGADIVQYTGEDGPAIEGVKEVHYLKGNPEQPILFRTQCFAKHDGPATFLDTDMICCRPIDSDLGDYDVGICKRTYDLDGYINTDAFSFDLSEYKRKKIRDVWPYVGCVSIVRNSDFWKDCLERYLAMDEKFRIWFGDQEAVRDAVKSYKVRDLPENKYARLLDFDNNPGDAYLLHFKGKTRKAWMARAAIHLGLMTKEENAQAA